jgi:hypothetical protein
VQQLEAEKVWNTARPVRRTAFVARPDRSSRPSASMCAGANDPSAFLRALFGSVLCTPPSEVYPASYSSQYGTPAALRNVHTSW